MALLLLLLLFDALSAKLGSKSSIAVN